MRSSCRSSIKHLAARTAQVNTARRSLRDMLQQSFMLVAFLAASFYFSWRLTLGSLLIAPIIAWLTTNFGRSLRSLARDAYEGSQQLVDTAQEALANQTIVKAYRAEEREQTRFVRVARQIMRANLRTSKITGFAPPIIEMVGVVAVAVLLNYANEGREVLRHINLRIPAGQVVALVGESGGGKSTLTKLIPRFHDPTAGAVVWDGTDLRDARLESLRMQIAIVTQETVLFNDTVRYNISYSRPDADAQEIEQAARIAFAHDFIKELPHGYETIVGERGIFLSGGQRQRLAIARAVLANASVLVLDEATSALDTESERLVQQALANLMQNRTSIVIAHRLSTVRRADLICVIERGRIIELGRHADLLAQSGTYKRLYELQFADEEEEEMISRQ